MDLDIKRTSNFDDVVNRYSSDNMIKRELQRLYSEMTDDERMYFMKILEGLEYYTIIPGATRKLAWSEIRFKTPEITVRKFNEIVRKYKMLFQCLGFSFDTAYGTVTISFLDPKFE